MRVNPSRVLHLASATAPGWARDAISQLDELLVDHAHCEKKAASTALNLIFRYVDQENIVGALSPLAREELQHFEQVLRLLRSRGLALSRLQPAPYAARLHDAINKEEPQRLVDTLLCCALIEARSCERMTLLAAALEEAGDADLAGFYRSLLASEARHFRTYLDLALPVLGATHARRRLEVLAAHEATCLLPSPGRLHG